jgi:hypothetical protein
MYGAADALARGLSAVRNPLEGPLYERYLQRARASADQQGVAAEFRAAWAAGAGASRHTAVAVALGEAPPPTSANASTDAASPR